MSKFKYGRIVIENGTLLVRLGEGLLTGRSRFVDFLHLFFQKIDHKSVFLENQTLFTHAEDYICQRTGIKLFY